MEDFHDFQWKGWKWAEMTSKIPKIPLLIQWFAAGGGKSARICENPPFSWIFMKIEDFHEFSWIFMKMEDFHEFSWKLRIFMMFMKFSWNRESWSGTRFWSDSVLFYSQNSLCGGKGGEGEGGFPFSLSLPQTPSLFLTRRSTHTNFRLYGAENLGFLNFSDRRAKRTGESFGDTF